MYYSQRGLGREPERTRGGGFGVEALADNDGSWKDKKLRGDAKTVCCSLEWWRSGLAWLTTDTWFVVGLDTVYYG